MTTETKARYILELDILPELFQVHVLEKRFEIARKVSNACKGKMKDNIERMKADKGYKKWLSQPKSKERSHMLNAIRERFDVSKGGAERIVQDMGKHFIQKKKKSDKKKAKQKVHLDSHTVQKIALDVWKSAESVLFKKGKKMHFKKYGTFDTLEGKTNKSGIYYRDGILHFNGLELKVDFPMKDKYVQQAMHDDIAFCRIVRKTIRGKVKYYLQLVLKGIPPQKQAPVDGELGIDIGISTVATASDEAVHVEEFCEGLDQLEREKRLLLRQMDRSRRATNPNKFNPDGTYKKGNRDKWVRPNRYWKLLFQLKELHRKIAAVRKIQHQKLANAVLKTGNDIKVEKMSYKGMQKGLYGKRIGYKAPSSFLTILNRKLGYQGKELRKVDTWSVKASQYCPIADSYTKKPLSQRFHVLPDGTRIQRDCFSAWLIKHVDETLKQIDRTKCLADFDRFLTAYQKTEARLRSRKTRLISSIGL